MVLGWLLLGPTLVAIPTILIPGTVFAVVIMRDVWRAVPTRLVGATAPLPNDPLPDRSSGQRGRGELTTLGWWALGVAALVYVIAAAVYVTGDDTRRFIVLGSSSIVGGVLAVRWVLRR